jgi:hypothetical protein
MQNIEYYVSDIVLGMGDMKMNKNILGSLYLDERRDRTSKYVYYITAANKHVDVE